jgi:branched-chain amino acid transport system ATP-binding protein
MHTLAERAVHPRSSVPLLEVRGLHAGYGSRDVLFGVDFSVMPGEVVTVLGHNGAGKSTTLKAVMGLVRASRGSIALDSTDVTALSPPDRVQRGLAYSPQQHFVFPDLTIAQNLAMGQYAWRGAGRSDARRAEVLELFPVLGERLKLRARTLSGGQQRMLGLAMAMCSEPRLLVLDELSLGISPRLFENILLALQSFHDRHGVAILLVEQHIERALEFASRAIVIRNGEIVTDVDASALRHSPELWELF